jgi:hypothetical protein
LSHIADGLCVGCLLESGLGPLEEIESPSLADMLAEVNLPDQNWRLGNYEILEEMLFIVRASAIPVALWR